MIAIPTKSQTTREVLKTGFRVWRDTFWRILPFAFLSGLLLMAQPWEVTKDGGTFAKFIPLLNWILTLILNAGMIYRIDSIVQNKDLGFKHALYIGFRKAPVLMIASLLYLLSVVGGLIFLIVPGLILLISLVFSTYLVVITDIKVLNSLKVSYRLVSGHWWYVAGVSLLLFLFCLVGVVVLTTIMIVIIQLNATYGFGVSVEGISLILATLIYIWYATYLYSNMLALLYDLQIKSSLQKSYSVEI